MRPSVGVGFEFDDVNARAQERGIKAQGFLDPKGADAIALHSAGGRERARLADGLVIDEDFDIATGVGATESEAQGGLPAWGLRQAELDGPSGGLNFPPGRADELGQGIVDVIFFANHAEILGEQAGRLHVVPIFAPVAAADDVIDVIGKFFGVIEVKSPLPVVITVEILPRRAVGHPDLPQGATISARGPSKLAKLFCFTFSNDMIFGPNTKMKVKAVIMAPPVRVVR